MFNVGDVVSVKRTSGVWEHEWVVAHVGATRVAVTALWEGEPILKNPTAAELSEWQEQAMRVCRIPGRPVTTPAFIREGVDQFIREALA